MPIPQVSDRSTIIPDTQASSNKTRARPFPLHAYLQNSHVNPKADLEQDIRLSRVAWTPSLTSRAKLDRDV